MIRRRAERRSDTGMVFLLDPGGSQVEIRQGRKQFYEFGPAGSSLFSSFKRWPQGISAVNSALSEEKAFGDMDSVFGPIVMRPPFAPSTEVFAERSAGDGLQSGADQILRRRLEGIIIEEIQELGNGGEALLTREHAGSSKVGGRAFADLLRGIVGQNGKKRIDGFRGAQHGQSLDGPEARLLIAVMRVAKKGRQNRCGLNAAIAESAESPEREIAAVRIVMNLIEKFCETLRRLPQVVGDEIDFHGGDAHARVVGVECCKHQMEELIGVFQMAAPGIQICVDQAKRLVGLVDGKFEEAFGLLLGRQVADCLHLGVIDAGIGGWQ